MLAPKSIPHRAIWLLRRVARRLWRLPVAVLIFAARCYQWTISPALGRPCRFDPTCSSYFIASVERRGAVIGTLRGLRRICRCHPWHPGGYDPP